MKSKIISFVPSRKKLSLIIGSLMIGALSPLVQAQIGSASVHGVVAAQLEPQPGVAVTARNTENGFIYKAVTQKDGTYTFKGLAPGSYVITVADKSGKPSEPVVLRVGQNLAFDFEIAKPVSGVEEVMVIGTKAKYGQGGEIGTNVSLEQIATLPQATRNFLAFADMAPGVQFTQAGDGSTQLKGGAQSANAINVFIDGVGQKGYVLGGGITGQDSSRGNPFPQSAIGEYKVITQNYSAEYDQISSAAIVAVTKSGTNEFHGEAFYNFTNQGMREMRPIETLANKKSPSQQMEYGVSVGGPIIKDKMHFFVAYEAKNNSDPKDIYPEGGYTPATFPSALISEVGGRSADFNEDMLFGKLDYVINDEQKAILTVKRRTENELTGIGGINSYSYGTDKKNDDTRIDLNHSWRTDSWLNEVHLTHEDANWSPRPHTNEIGKRYSNNGNTAVINIGGGPDYQNKGQKGWGFQEDFTYLSITDHVIKAGFKYKAVTLHAAEQQPYNPQFEYNLDYSLDKPFKVRWGKPLAGIGDGSAESDNKQLGIYLQDEWTATDRLTINAGLRWDHEESGSYLDYVTPSDVLSGIQSWVGIKKSNIDINDYISNGHNRSSDNGQWQPRVGFTYDLSDDNDVVLFGGYGRAFDRNLFDYLQLETTKSTYPTYEYFFNNGDPKHTCVIGSATCVSWDSKYLSSAALNQLVTSNNGAGREVFMLNNNLKTPYSDQFSLGVRGSLNEDWKAEASVSRIVSKDGFAWRLANRRDNGSFFNGSDTWGAPWGYGIPGFGATIIGDNGLETKANSLFVKLDKPKTENGWGMALAYTFTKAKTNREVGEVFSLDYPSFSDYKFLPVNKAPEHRLVLTGSVDLPAGVLMTTKLNLQSVANYYGTDCRAGWNHCKLDTFKPDDKGFLGYKSLDLAFSKVVPTDLLVADSKLTARLDIINLTNAVNYSAFENWIGGAGEEQNPNLGKPTGEIAGYPLTIKLGVNWSW